MCSGWLFICGKATHLEKHNQRFTSIRPKQLFFSTLKNPKAVLFAAGIFPYEAWDNPTNFFLVFAVFTSGVIANGTVLDVFWPCHFIG